MKYKNIFIALLFFLIIACNNSFELQNLTENEEEIFSQYEKGVLYKSDIEKNKTDFVSLVSKLIEDNQISEAELLIKIAGALPSFFQGSELAKLYYCEGVIQNNHGQKEKALDSMKKSTELFSVEENIELAMVYIKTSEILTEIGRVKKAYGYSRKASEILENNIERNELLFVKNILLSSQLENRLNNNSSEILKKLESNVYFRKLKKSENEKEKALYAAYLQLCAELSLESKELEKAESYTDKAQKEAELLKEWRLLAKCSEFYAEKILPLKKFPEKKNKEFKFKLYLTASEYVSRTDDLLFKSMIYFKLADSIFDLSSDGIYEEISADDLVEDALEGFNAISNSFQSDANYRSFMNAMVSSYERYMDMLIKNEKYEKALYISEMLRSWKLRNIMQSRSLEPEALLTKEGRKIILNKISHRKRLERHLMEISKNSFYYNKDEASRIQSQIKDLEVEIKKLRLKYTTYKYKIVRTEPAEIKDVMKSLKKGEMLVVFYLNRNNTAYRWTLTREDLSFKKIMLDSSIDGVVKDISAGFPGYDLTTMRFYFNKEKAFFVYTRLFKDIFDSKQKPDYLIIVPHKNMAQIPFDALVTEYSNTRVRYLIQKGTPISITPSLTIYQMKKTSKKKYHGTGFLGYIEPDYAGYAAQLPMTIPYIKNFASNFRKSDIYMKNDALESHFKKRKFYKYKYLHVSTHGAFKAKYNREPFIMFAMRGDPKDDGYLYAKEVYPLNMKLKSVAFDACLTAVGNIDPYEGIVGFSHALSASGAEYMLLTQWAIYVDTGRVFFDSYYRKVSQGKNIRDAYYEAKIRTMKENSDPVYWGPICLYE